MVTAPSKPPLPLEGGRTALVTAELDVGGMHCGACATRIQKSLGRLPAVASASVNLATTRAYVTYDPEQLSRDDLCCAVTAVGYTATPVDTGSKATSDEDSDYCSTHGHIQRLPPTTDVGCFRKLIDEAYVVYPEVLQGNPLNARRVVRYVLNTPAANGYPMLEGGRDFIVSFSSQFWERPDCVATILVDEPIFNDDNSRPALASDRNLPPDLDHLIAGQAEEVADMDGVALHHGEEPLLPGRQAQAVLAADHRLMADIIGDVVEIDRAAQRFAGGEQLGNVGTLHESETRFRAPEIRRDFLDSHAVAG